jgi:hypothetical protein
MLDSNHKEDESNKKTCIYRVMLQMLPKKILKW